MIKGDAEYNKHFYWMVMEGLCCGLGHPAEWLTSYDRCIGMQLGDEIANVTEFVNIAAVDIYETMHCSDAGTVTLKQANDWISDYYKPKVCPTCDNDSKLMDRCPTCGGISKG